MARGYNNVQLIGTVTQQPELRYTSGGLAILEMQLAGIDTVKGDDDIERDMTWYHKVSFLGKSAELLAELVQPNNLVFVEAGLNFRSWESDGQKRSALDLKGVRCDILQAQHEIVTDSRGQQRNKNAINQVTLIGNLTQDAEMKYTQNGKALLRLNVAVNDNYRRKDGTEVEQVHYVTVISWGALAESAANLTKGAGVLVHGRFNTNSWEQDGVKRYQNQVDANRIEFLYKPNQTQPMASSKQPSQPIRNINLDIDEFPPEDDMPF